MVNRIKTEEGRKPAARSSSGRGVSSSRSVPEASGGLSAEPWSRPPSSPPRRLLSGRVSVSPFTTAVCQPTLPSPCFFLGLLRLRETAAAAAEQGWLLGLGGSPVGLGTVHPEKPAVAEPAPPWRRARQRACNLALSAGNQSRGLAGKVDGSHGWFYF